MRIRFIDAEYRAPAGKLADAECWFDEGPFAGLKLIGFGIWQARDGARINVTMPARQYSVNGERRSFSLMRAQTDAGNIDRLRDLIVAAYHDHTRAVALEEAPALQTLAQAPTLAQAQQQADAISTAARDIDPIDALTQDDAARVTAARRAPRF